MLVEGCFLLVGVLFVLYNIDEWLFGVILGCGKCRIICGVM